MKSRTATRTARPGLEALEGRALPAVTLINGVISIRQTAGNDRAVVHTTATGFAVYDNGTKTEFTAAQVTGRAIMYYGLGGNDSFTNRSSLRTTARGGAGNDAVIGGTSADILLGEQAVDVLFGRMGADTLIGGEDNDRLIGGVGDAGSPCIASEPNPAGGDPRKTRPESCAIRAGPAISGVGSHRPLQPPARGSPPAVHGESPTPHDPRRKLP